MDKEEKRKREVGRLVKKKKKLRHTYIILVWRRLRRGVATPRSQIEYRDRVQACDTDTSIGATVGARGV
jgi:hypothetical protein